MKQVIFESSPAFIILCGIVALGYATLLYRRKNPWGRKLNWFLYALRALVAFTLALFLVGPIVKLINNTFEKPVFVVLQDNSASIKETTGRLTRSAIVGQATSVKGVLENAGYEVVLSNLSGDGLDSTYEALTTDLHESLRSLSNQFEGRRLDGVILISDGIYNSGLSPLFGNYNFPLHTIGIGDTTQRSDVSIKNIAYNKIAYQGNKFPIRADISVKGFSGENLDISLSHKGQVVERKTLVISDDGIGTIDFQPLAAEQGIQRWDVRVEPKTGERNTRNNSTTVFIEVVEGRKKIMVVASAPHPDIKVLRSVIEQNSNFEFILHVPGVEETTPSNLQPENIDLVIFHQAPDIRGKTRALFDRFAQSKTSLFIVLGQATDLNILKQHQMPLSFEQPPRQYDEVTPLINPNFSSFGVSTDAISQFATFPPVQVHFGKMQIPITALPLLTQKVGSLATEKPLLFVLPEESRRIAMMLGDGMWRWRLHEYSKTEKTTAFDEVIGKLIQYMSTADDKRKFKSYTVKQQFTDTEPVIFESQVYNDIYEPVYGNTVELVITDEQGKQNNYQYITSPGNSRYPIGGLKEGVYKYVSATSLNGQGVEERGQFIVVAQQLELLNLTADFGLLRNLARSSGGGFYKHTQWDKLENDLTTKKANSIIRTEERYDSLINLKWIFFLLLLLVSGEWFLRKFYGSY